MHRKPPSGEHWELSRREFCRLSLATFAVLSHGWLHTGCTTPITPPEEKKPPTLPTCKTVSTHEEKTIEALCETCIPGLKTDPKKIPGAADVCAVDLFFDPELPAAPLVPLIVLLIDSKANELYKKKFVELTPQEQFDAIDNLDRSVELFGFAIQLVRLAYYSTEIASYYLGYPGSNGGYVQHPHFSFRKPMSQEMTTDGNLP